MLLLVFLITIFIRNNNFKTDLLLGGNLNSLLDYKENSIYTTSISEEDYNEQYHRPSKNNALDNKYSYNMFVNNKIRITNSKDVVYAYYGILEEASNMIGFTGGCGTIGNSSEPYNMAYDLLSDNYKKKITNSEFVSSFKGIGHITFLKIHKLKENSNYTYYFVEIEIITGKTEKENPKYEDEISYFAYYYGVITTIKENGDWKINNIDYYPEEFLCAPYHSWFYDSNAIIGIVYKENLKIIDEITNTSINDDVINIYAKKDTIKYRFDFIRITNGHDILIRENIMQGDIYVQVDILSGDWKSLKLDIK